MAQKQLLIFSWEYLGHHSVQGTALAKRPRQVAESFVKNGWQVILIHRDGTGECGDNSFTVNCEQSGVIRIPVKMVRSYDDKGRNALVRKLSTLFYVAFRGDRSYRWAIDVIGNFDAISREVNVKPDQIISFYTPRGPLHLGNYFSKKLGVPWIADIQDPIAGGISGSSLAAATRWMRNTLKSAKAIVHISPEWAAIDSAQVNLKFDTIRHAIPRKIDPPTITDDVLKDYKDYFNIFYGGSMSAAIQSLDLLKKIIEYGATVGIKVKVHLAGNDNAYRIFREGLGQEYIHHLGWVSADLMNQYIFSCDCTAVIPWSKVRIGIPSKFYELCSYPKPIWVIGYDLGAFDTLMDEWQHPKIQFGDFEFQKNTLLSAVKGDFNNMFNLSNCKGKYLLADDLCNKYTALM